MRESDILYENGNYWVCRNRRANALVVFKTGLTHSVSDSAYCNNPDGLSITDTFAGEANYCWVKRFTIPTKEGESKLALMRRAKKESGLNGVKCRVSDYGDSYRLDIVGACIVCFISWIEPEHSYNPENAE